MPTEYYYKSIKQQLLCEDGVRRTVFARHYTHDGSLAPDTYFSVPAYVQVRKTSVSGFINASGHDDGSLPTFVAYSYGKNHSLINDNKLPDSELTAMNEALEEQLRLKANPNATFDISRGYTTAVAQ